MKIADIPDKFPIPFANAAGGSYIRPIPEASQIGIEGGAASLTDGFPPLNFQPRGAGGIPPFGEDFNGLLNQITAWTQWQGAGATVTYDSDFSTAIGGYPKGACLASSVTAGLQWVSTADDNTTDPDGMTSANWVAAGANPALAIQAQAGNYAADTGVANAYAIAPTPNVPAYAGGQVFRFVPKAGNTNTGASTLAVSTLAAKAIVYPSGLALQAGDIVENVLAEVCYQATLDKFVLLNAAAQYSIGAGSGFLRIPGTKFVLQWMTYSIPVTSSVNVPSPMLWGVGTITYPFAFTGGVITAWAAPSFNTDTHAVTASVQSVVGASCQLQCADTTSTGQSIGTLFVLGYM